MKNILQLISKMVCNGKVIMICFFLLAACIPHDESLAPMNHHEDLLSENLAQGSEVSESNKRTFTAHLSGGNEVPPVDRNGQGQVIFKLSKDGTELHYKLIVANTEKVTQAHIHCGNAGVNGPVVVFLFGFVTGGVSENGVLKEGVITSSNIIARPNSVACMGGLATFANLLDRLQDGSLYVNVHTVAFPGGEIRGQIQ